MPTPTQPRTPSPDAPHPALLILRVALYGGLALTAMVTVVFGDRLWRAFREGWVPVWAPLLAPVAFTALVGVFTLDRVTLVRAGTTAPARALLQVAFCLVFLTLLWPHQRNEMRQPPSAPPTRSAPYLLLTHPDAAVRAAGCELLAGQVAPAVRQRVAQLAGEDVPAVRRACAPALGRIWAEGALD